MMAQALVCATLAVALCAAADRGFDPKADPEKDLAAAKEAASKAGKRILVKVGGEWCGWCHRMDRFIAETASLREALESGFVVLKVNYSEENKNERFLGRLPKIEGYPHLFVFEKDGRLLHSQETGSLEEGKGYSRERFEAFLAEWSPRR